VPSCRRPIGSPGPTRRWRPSAIRCWRSPARKGADDA
jgi:hypothetical protein